MNTKELQILLDATPLRLMTKLEIDNPERWYSRLINHTNTARDFNADMYARRHSINMIALLLLDYTTETKNLFSSHQQQVIEHIKDRLNDDPILPEDMYYD